MNEQLKVSSSPHIRDKVTTSNIMLMVVIALLPATFFGIYNFRHEHAWVLVVVTTLTAVATEYIYERLMHKTITIKDFSAVVTGLLLALNLPPTLPVWMGSFRLDICNSGCKAAFRWAWPELHEPGAWSQMFSFDFFYRKDDVFCI